MLLAAASRDDLASVPRGAENVTSEHRRITSPGSMYPECPCRPWPFSGYCSSDREQPESTVR